MPPDGNGHPSGRGSDGREEVQIEWFSNHDPNFYECFSRRDSLGRRSAAPGPAGILWLLDDDGVIRRVVGVDVDLGTVDDRPVR